MATLTSNLIVALKDRFSGPSRGIGASIDRLNRRATRMNSSIVGGGTGMIGGSVRNLMALGVGYVGVTRGIGGTVGAAIKFEEAFADVRKVVDGTPAQLSAVRSEILAMSKTLPVTAEGIASIYAAAGQSGVGLDELGKFSEMAAKVSVAWDTSQAETGDALAKIKTQLGLNVDELGVYADAINHLSNNSASAAPDLVDYAKRVAAVGKISGFQTTETLAFGSAMISAGAQSEVAATSFRNMGRALTKGGRATKMQREAFSSLGLDSIKVAKNMQKNALKTTLDVIERIQKLPEWQHMSIASALFGDEARAMMPVIANTKELRRELAMVADEATFTGSAFNEYLVRSTTAANALQLIGNKFRAVGISIGDGWLPTIKELGAGIGDVLDTLDKRVGVLDQVKSSFQGFMGGIGYGGTGDMRRMMNDLGDLLFGEAFGGQARDADDRVIGLARLSNRFRQIGQDLKSFADNVSGGNIGAAVSNVGAAISGLGGGLSVGGALAIGLTGRAMMGLAAGAAALALSPIGRIAIAATAVAAIIDAAQGANSLGEFVENLKGLSAIQWTAIGGGVLLLVGRVARLAGVAGRLARSLGLIAAAGGVEALVGGNKPNTPKTPVNAGAAAGAGGLLTALGSTVIGAAIVAGVGIAIAKYGPGVVDKGTKPERGTPGDWLGIDPTESREDRLERLNSRRSSGGQLSRGRDRGDVERDLSLGAFLTGPSLSGGPTDVNIAGVPEISIPGPVTTQPSGTQDVRVTNPMPAPVVNITIHTTTNASPAEIGEAAERALSAKLTGLYNGAFHDGVN